MRSLCCVKRALAGSANEVAHFSNGAQLSLERAVAVVELYFEVEEKKPELLAAHAAAHGVATARLS